MFSSEHNEQSDRETKFRCDVCGEMINDIGYGGAIYPDEHPDTVIVAHKGPCFETVARRRGVAWDELIDLVGNLNRRSA